MSELTTFWPPLAAVAVCALASIHDLRTGHIPNWLTLGTWASAMSAHAGLAGFELGPEGIPVGLLRALAGTVLAVAVPVLLYARGGIGGGDVKLLGAVGALCGPFMGMNIEVAACLIAALYVGVKLAHQGRLRAATVSALLLLPRLVRPGRRRLDTGAAGHGELRFAPSVFAATCLVALAQLAGAA